jgi:tetratricopeptide (TPR) repeat protein
LHARAGAVIELQYANRVDERADVLSLHYLQAERFDKAWHYARVAGAHAHGAYAYVEAARFYGHALSAARHLTGLPSDEVAGTWESLGDVRLRLGEFMAAGLAYSQARKGFRDKPLALARVQFRAAQVADLAADYPRSLRWMSTARRTLALAEDSAAATLRAEISGFYGLIRHRQGHELDAVRWCRRAVAEAEAAGARPALAAALASLDVSETMLGRGDGRNTVRALEIWRGLGDAWQEARAHNNLGIRAYFAGRWDDAVASYENARAAAERAGDQWMATIAAANVVEIRSDQGRLAEAEPRVLDVLRTLRATGARGALSFGQGLYGRLLARSGRFEEALDQYAAARTLQVADGEQVLLLETDVRIAECLAWQGMYGAALQAAADALARLESVHGASGLVPLVHRVRGLALGGLGDVGGGMAALRSSISAARERSAPHEVAWGLDVLLMLADAASDGSAGSADADGAGSPAGADADAERLALADMLGITAFPHQRPRRSRGRVQGAGETHPTSVG